MPQPVILVPNMLEADATVPQCLDNQYVANGVFARMVTGSVGYDDAVVRTARARDARTEFRRSLVYSSQVVIQRAFFVNSRIVFENYLPGDVRGLAAFAGLLTGTDGAAQAIVPYLHKSTSFADDFGFAEDPRGREALDALMDVVGDTVPSVRLDGNEENNLKLVGQLERKFGGYFSGDLRQLLNADDDGALNEMAAELFGPRHEVLQQPGAFDTFKAQLSHLAEKASAGVVSRTSLYEDLLVQGNGDEERARNVPRGFFRAPEGADRFVFEIKKLVDLVYNSNLPDRLGRYTFTPVDMPSRLAMQDFSVGNLTVNVADTAGLVQESERLKTDIGRMFMANAERAMRLPELGELTIPDVVAIRRLPEWAEFAQAQSAILQNPLDVLHHLEGFSAAFNKFQLALSHWYFQNYARADRATRYANVATVALQIAGHTLISLGFNGDNAATILAAHAAGAGLEQFIPRKVKGCMINLMVYVVDVERHIVDRDRSYSIELMRSETEYTREQVLELVRGFTGGPVLDDRDATQLPAQGGA